MPQLYISQVEHHQAIPTSNWKQKICACGRKLFYQVSWSQRFSKYPGCWCKEIRMEKRSDEIQGTGVFGVEK